MANFEFTLKKMVEDQKRDVAEAISKNKQLFSDDIF